MEDALPILITLVLTVPILFIGTWLYLKRRSFSPRTRIVLASAVFLFVFISGPVMFWLWRYKGVTNDFLAAGSGGRKLVGQLLALWLVGVFTIGLGLYRLWRKKGEL